MTMHARIEKLERQLPSRRKRFHVHLEDSDGRLMKRCFACEQYGAATDGDFLIRIVPGRRARIESN